MAGRFGGTGRTLATTDQKAPAISLKRITKSYQGRDVVKDLSLDVAHGEFLAILGPSGSGKTTTMRLIAGFEAPDGGSVFIDGSDVTAIPAERRPVNTVFQSYALFPHMSVLDNVAFGPRMRGVARSARHRKAEEMLALVRLSDRAGSRPHELSGGMQQRVALARALANDPAVLLLDEPIGALDRQLREEMQRELRRVQSELGATFIYVTHDQEEAFGMADRLAVMRAGRLEQIGDPADVYDRPANAWVAQFVGGTNRFEARVSEIGGIVRLETGIGMIASCDRSASLDSGSRAIAMVRPEATRFERPVADPANAAVNRLPGRLVDTVAVGPWIRLRAGTPNGIEVESIARRVRELESLSPGDEVSIVFDAEDLRIFAASDTGNGESRQEGVAG